MEDIWGHGEHIQCMHPAANCIEGRDLVSLVVPPAVALGRTNVIAVLAVYRSLKVGE